MFKNKLHSLLVIVFVIGWEHLSGSWVSVGLMDSLCWFLIYSILIMQGQDSQIPAPP